MKGYPEEHGEAAQCIQVVPAGVHDHDCRNVMSLKAQGHGVRFEMAGRSPCSRPCDAIGTSGDDVSASTTLWGVSSWMK